MEGADLVGLDPGVRRGERRRWGVAGLEPALHPFAGQEAVDQVADETEFGESAREAARVDKRLEDGTCSELVRRFQCEGHMAAVEHAA